MDKLNKIIEADFKEILRKVDIRKARGKNVLITGASGFLGQYLVGALSLANRERRLRCKIHAVGLNAPRSILQVLLRQDKNLSYRRIDLSRPFKNLRGYDYIFHAAGYGQPARFIANPRETIGINIEATQSLLEQSPGSTFIYFSTGEIYGNIPKRLYPAKEDFNGDSPLHLPRSVYAEAKRLGEALCAAYQRNGRNQIKIARIMLNYGPGLPADDTRVMSDFIRKALTEKKIKLLDKGLSIKTYGYAADTAAMILFIGLNGKEMVYNVGGQDRLTIKGLAEKIAKYFNIKYQLPTSASQLAHIGKDPKWIGVDLSKIKKEMKHFKFTPFSEGLKKTIEWTKLNLA